MKKRFLIGLLVLLMAVSLGLKWALTDERAPKAPPLVKLPSIGFNVNILAIDYGHLKAPYIQKSIRKGTLFFLIALKEQKNEIIVDILDNLNALKAFDTNNNHIIDLTDAGYYRLFLGRFDQARRTIYYHSLSHSGVGSIRLEYTDGHVRSAQAKLRINDVLPIIEVRIQVTSPKKINVENTKDIPLKHKIIEYNDKYLGVNL